MPTMTFWTGNPPRWNTEERQMATEIALNVLLVTLHEAGHLPLDRLHYHLARATNQAEEQLGDVFPDLVAALDELRDRLDGLLRPQSWIRGYN